MKLLVLALCVCAASAASFGGYKPQQATSAFAKAVAAPFVAAPAAALTAAKATYDAASYVASAPVVAAKAVYNAGNQVYNAGQDGAATIVRSDSDVTADGFNYYYETSNGIAAQAAGTSKKVDNADVFVVQGSYKYVAPDGTPVQFNYVADENGYQPQSDLLPVGPPIPEAIARSLEYIRANYKPENY